MVEITEKLPPVQEEIIKKMLPWAMNKTSFGLGITPLEGQNNYKAIKRMLDSGILQERDIPGSKSYSKTGRNFLTQKGIASVISNNEAEDPLNKIDTTKSITVRNGMSADNLARMIRASDAQNFLASAGVENIYTSVTKHGINPFVFGLPSIKARKSGHTLFHETVIKALADHIEEAESSGYPYPTLDEHCDFAIFIPNAVIDISKTSYKEKDTHGKYYNNAVGMLINTITKNAFIVYKSLDRKASSFWPEKAYVGWLSRYAPTIRKLGIKNIDEYGKIKDAIMLCETTGEISNRALACDPMAKPYRHVYPILMKQSGLDDISSILSIGIDEYEDALICEALDQIPAAQRSAAASSMYKIHISNAPVYVGTQMDYAKLSMLKSIYSRSGDNKPIVACYEDQVSLYCEAAGIPEQKIAKLKRSL